MNNTSTTPGGRWTLFKLHLRSAQDLSADDWDLIDHIMTEDFTHC
jgi:hypothetical protein